MTMDAAELRVDLLSRLRGAGLAGRGMRLHQRQGDVTWVVEVERSRYIPQYDVIVGVDLDAHEKPPPVNMCQIFVDIVLFIIFGEGRWRTSGGQVGWREIGEALSLRSVIEDGDRRHRLDLLTQVLSGYIAEHSTTDDIDRAVMRGDFDCGFVSKDVRQRLEAWPSAT